MASRERREPRGRNFKDARRLPCLTNVAVPRAQGPQERLERLLRMLLHHTRPDNNVFGAVGHRCPERSWDLIRRLRGRQFVGPERRNARKLHATTRMARMARIAFWDFGTCNA